MVRARQALGMTMPHPGGNCAFRARRQRSDYGQEKNGLNFLLNYFGRKMQEQGRYGARIAPPDIIQLFQILVQTGIFYASILNIKIKFFRNFMEARAPAGPGNASGTMQVIRLPQALTARRWRGWPAHALRCGLPSAGSRPTRWWSLKAGRVQSGAFRHPRAWWLCPAS